MKTRALLLALLALPITARTPHFQHWDESQLSQPAYAVLMENDVQVPMRDGTLLSADIYLPDAPGPFPTLLWRTPYNNNGAGEVEQSKWFASRGYAVVVQDVRGKYDSGGHYRLFADEADDGYDTDEWVGRQPWSNGRIGTLGGSYLGYTQIAQAIRGSRYLTATVELYAATSVRDTDWTAKLVDVHPDGYAQNLQDGIVRARYRHGTTAPATLLEPGRIYQYTIDLWATSNVFLPGHRIRVEISSSNFPRFDRNLNTGEDPFTGTRMETARQTVYHSARYPSHIVLPVIPRAAAIR